MSLLFVELFNFFCQKTIKSSKNINPCFFHQDKMQFVPILYVKNIYKQPLPLIKTFKALVRSYFPKFAICDGVNVKTYKIVQYIRLCKTWTGILQWWQKHVLLIYRSCETGLLRPVNNMGSQQWVNNLQRSTLWLHKIGNFH